MNDTKYWIPNHRYLELKHFCLQYPEWKKLLKKFKMEVSRNLIRANGRNFPERPTENLGISLGEILGKVSLIEEVCKETDEGLWRYILMAVAYGDCYGRLKEVYKMPCSRAIFSEKYRKFFWLLDKSQ